MRGGRLRGRTGAILMSVGILVIGAGCASKQVASVSGDRSTTMKGKGEAPGVSESVRQEPLASVETGQSIEPAPSGGAKESPMTAPAPGSGTVPSSSAAPGSRASVSSSAVAPASTASSEGLSDVYFDFDQYNIRSDAQTVLDANARWLRTESATSVLIEGHCDERGTLAYNLVLGEKRAKAAKRYLEDLGIPASRMKTISYGEVRPVCKEQHEGCYSRNRRAHFVVQ